jgi:hypothetical protein
MASKEGDLIDVMTIQAKSRDAFAQFQTMDFIKML